MQAHKSHTNLGSTFFGPAEFAQKAFSAPESLSVGCDVTATSIFIVYFFAVTTTRNIHIDLGDLSREKSRPQTSFHFFNRNLKCQFHFPGCFQALVLKVAVKYTCITLEFRFKWSHPLRVFIK
jgi:hypothetical protein